MENQVAVSEKNFVAPTDTVDPRFLPIVIEGKTYITSTLLHSQKRAAGMVQYIRNGDFLRVIRLIPSFSELLELGHLLEISSMKSSDAKFASIMKANHNKNIMLIDPVAQKAIEHFLDDEQSKESSLQTNQSSAIQGMSGIDLTTLDVTDPATLFALQFLKEKTDHIKTMQLVEKKTDENEFQQKVIGGQTGTINKQRKLIKEQSSVIVELEEKVKSYVSPTVIGQALGGKNPREVNKLLEAAGLQEVQTRNGKNSWKLTEKGLNFGKMFDVDGLTQGSYVPKQIRWELASVKDYLATDL